MRSCYKDKARALLADGALDVVQVELDSTLVRVRTKLTFNSLSDTSLHPLRMMSLDVLRLLFSQYPEACLASATTSSKRHHNTIITPS
jgi:hypothetical protein